MVVTANERLKFGPVKPFIFTYEASSYVLSFFATSSWSPLQIYHVNFFCCHVSSRLVNTNLSDLQEIFRIDTAVISKYAAKTSGRYYLTIIPRARMGYWLRGHEDERNNCFSKIHLIGQKHRDKTTLAGAFRY